MLKIIVFVHSSISLNSSYDTSQTFLFNIIRPFSQRLTKCRNEHVTFVLYEQFRCTTQWLLNVKIVENQMQIKRMNDHVEVFASKPRS